MTSTRGRISGTFKQSQRNLAGLTVRDALALASAPSTLDREGVCAKAGPVRRRGPKQSPVLTARSSRPLPRQHDCSN